MPTWNKAARLLAAFILAMTLTASQAAIKPPAAHAGIIPGIPGLPNPCDLIPDATARKICKYASDPASAIGAIPGIPDPSQIVGDAVSAAGNAVLKPIVYAVTSAEADAVGTALRAEAKAVNATTQSDLTAKWFTTQYAVVFGMAVLLALMGFFGRIGQAAVNQDAAEVGWSSANFLVFLLGGGLLPGVVGLVVLTLDNTVAPAFMANAGVQTTDILNRLPNDIHHNLTQLNTIGGLIFPLIILFAGVVGWVLLELMFFFREGMLYLVTVAVVALWGLRVSGRQVGQQLFNNSVLLLLTLVFFKVIAAFVLVISLGLFGSKEGVQPVILGTVMLVMLPAIMWMIYQSRHNIRFVPLDTLNSQIRMQAMRVLMR